MHAGQICERRSPRLQASDFIAFGMVAGELPSVRFRLIDSALRKSIRIGVVSRREIPEQGRIAGQQAFEYFQAGPVGHEEVVRYAAGTGTSRAER
jgi:hypothetical protein